MEAEFIYAVIEAGGTQDAPFESIRLITTKLQLALDQARRMAVAENVARRVRDVESAYAPFLLYVVRFVADVVHRGYDFEEARRNLPNQQVVGRFRVAEQNSPADASAA